MPDSKSRLLAPAPSGVSAPNNAPRRKNVGTACKACKTRKLKCSGTAPCTNCLKSRQECTLDSSADKRRRGALKRKIDQLEDKEDLLIKLVESLRRRDTAGTGQLVNLIRSNASLAEIRGYMDRPEHESESPVAWDSRSNSRSTSHSQSQSQSQSPSSSRHILDAKRLSDIPLYRVPAKPWTTLTDDDDFVSHLVSLFFTWQQPFCPWIQRGLLLADMSAGKVPARFCSPFLVTVILAVACTYSDYPDACATKDDTSTRGFHFYEEARRLLQKEEGRMSLPTAQGVALLWAAAAVMGRRSESWMYRGQLEYAIQEIAPTDSMLAATADPDSLMVATHTTGVHWGLFNYSTMLALVENNAPAMKPPRRKAMLALPSHSCDDDWRPYPCTHAHAETSKKHTFCIFTSLCELSPVVYDILTTIRRTDLLPGDREKRAHELRDRLDHWRLRMRNCLVENISLPHVLSLHMYYHSIVITLNNAFPVPSSSYTSTSSAREIASLIDIHDYYWSLDRMPAIMLRWVLIALYALLPELQVRRDNYSAFVSLCMALKAFERRWSATGPFMQQVKAATAERGVEFSECFQS